MKLPFEWLKSIADCCSGEAAICKMERQLLELKTAAPIVDWPITNESNGNLWGGGGGARRVGPGQKRWTGNLFWFAAWSCVGKQYCRVPWREREERNLRSTHAILGRDACSRRRNDPPGITRTNSHRYDAPSRKNLLISLSIVPPASRSRKFFNLNFWNSNLLKLEFI